MSESLVRITKINAKDFKTIIKYLENKYIDVSYDDTTIVYRWFNPFKDTWFYFNLNHSSDGWLEVSLEDDEEVLKSFKQEKKYVSSNKLTAKELAEYLFSSYINYCSLVEERYTKALQKQPGHFEFKVRFEMQKNIME